MRVTMRRIQYDRYGGPEVMYAAEYEMPQLTEDQVRIQVKAAAINPFDWKLREGSMKWVMKRNFPKGMGTDFAGVVEEVGPNVTHIQVGDEVFGMLDFKQSGSFAEQIVVDSRFIAPKPPSFSFAEAACLPIPAMTAWTAVLEHAGLQPGSRLFINGCSGAVGAFAVQLALAHGVHVTGTCGPKSIEYVRTTGINQVFTYNDPASYLENGKFDAVFDTVGTLEVGRGLSMLQPKGIFIDINPAARRMIRGVASRRYKLLFATMGIKHLAAIGDFASLSKLQPTIGREAPFADALNVIRDVQTGKYTSGKNVLIM